jgi:glycosyltransferase involved in cell wall biosynthesis
MSEINNNINEAKELFIKYNCCIIIPTYNNEKTLSDVIESSIVYTSHIIVVNDGSTDSTESILKKYDHKIDIVEYAVNRGKGYALRQGFTVAFRKGYTYAITIDSDGQHITDDYVKFLRVLGTERDVVIIGARNMEQESVPGRSNFGRKFSNFWFWVETGNRISDTQSGFRLYPLNVLNGINFYTNRYEFEIEILVRLAWKGCKVLTVPVQVYYAPKEERVSHFRPFIDFMQVSILNTVLVTLAFLLFKPLLFYKTLKNQNYKKFIKEHFLNSKESNEKLSMSIALGILCGILPIWGYQMALALVLAHILRLNKIISVASSNISIPPMIPLILFSSYMTGNILLGNDSVTAESSSKLDYSFIKLHLQQYIVGSIILAVVLSIVVGFITYILLLVFRKRKIITS